ncbi:MAG: cell envelope protein [Pseudomonas sp.]|nr:cell envelope protein [Pseudomonas sp.]
MQCMKTGLIGIGLCALLTTAAYADFTATPSEAQAIAKEAYLYGFPVVESYKTLYTQAVDKGGPNYKAPFNKIGNTAKVFTPKDTAFITPNSDTPYSFIWLDLRTEPQVLTLPKVEAQRYYSVQLIDLYTQNFAYLGTRSTGNGGGKFMIAGPDWKGDTPAGIDKVIHSESNLVYALYRTQLFNDKDLPKVKQVQSGYKVQPLSAFAGQPVPTAAPVVDWPTPQKDMSETPALFRYLDFLLTFAPTDPSETALMQRFAKIGVGPGLTFDEKKLTEAQRDALQAGIKDGQTQFAEFKKTQIDTRKVSSGDFFGTREFLKNDYLKRYAGAALGIFGNSQEEALYPSYFVDDTGQPLNAATHNYQLHFAKGQLPPAKAFWSLTMYDGKSRLLVENPLKRYLINSRMLSTLKTDADGGITLYLQHNSPGKDKQSNWLPTPEGPFYTVLRIYLPEPQVLDGTWQRPPMTAQSR